MNNGFIWLSVLSALSLISSADYAYAYIDPGAGSLFLQVLVGLLASGAVTVKVYWKKIRTFFSRWLQNDN
jgi:hypothetical protein